MAARNLNQPVYYFWKEYNWWDDRSGHQCRRRAAARESWLMAKMERRAPGKAMGGSVATEVISTVLQQWPSEGGARMSMTSERGSRRVISHGQWESEVAGR